MTDVRIVRKAFHYIVFTFFPHKMIKMMRFFQAKMLDDLEEHLRNLLSFCGTCCRRKVLPKFSVKITRLTKSDDEFFQRTVILYNYVLRALKGARPSKTTLTQIYWNFFNKRYSQTDKCTWKILCRCGNCNTMTKLMTI